MERDMPQPMNAIDLLTQDHRTVDALFEEFESASGTSRKVTIANTICDELTVHATIEEEIFYPAALGALKKDDADLIWEATVEHGTLEGLIAVIRNHDGSDDAFEAHVTVLKEYVQHHVKEEENEMFPKVRATRLDLDALGMQLAERKEALMQSQGPRGGRRASGRGKTAAKKSAQRRPARKGAAAKRSSR